jgi:hypothetical protein
MANKPNRQSCKSQVYKTKKKLRLAPNNLRSTRNRQHQQTQRSLPKKICRNNINRQQAGNSTDHSHPLYTTSQFVKILNTVIGLIFACFIGGVLWILNAPQELVWVIFLTTGMFGIIYFVPLPNQYRNCAYTALAIVAGTFLIRALSFSQQAVIDLTKNPILEFVEKLVKLIFH